MSELKNEIKSPKERMHSGELYMSSDKTIVKEMFEKKEPPFHANWAGCNVHFGKGVLI